MILRKQVIKTFISWTVHSGPPMGGAGGYNDPGAHGLQVAHEGAHWLQKGRWL